MTEFSQVRLEAARALICDVFAFLRQRPWVVVVALISDNFFFSAPISSAFQIGRFGTASLRFWSPRSMSASSNT